MLWIEQTVIKLHIDGKKYFVSRCLSLTAGMVCSLSLKQKQLSSTGYNLSKLMFAWEELDKFAL